MDRRTFLKVTGLGSVAFAAGCTSEPKKHLYTFVHAPEDLVIGEPAWYATTCRECPAGCGVLAKNREGRIVKVEGNPLHPVNRGRLCVRGQSALQAVYNPDRIKKPLLKDRNGWTPISYEQAASLLSRRLEQAAAKGPDRVGLMSETVGDTLLDLFTKVTSFYKSQRPLVFEPFAFESLKFAHQTLFGQPVLPSYRMDQADVLIGFGADFLETWLSPVEYARKFKSMHAIENGGKGLFIHISPYQSMTAANADRWYACRPGSEPAVILHLIRAVIDAGRGQALPDSFLSAIKGVARGYSIEQTAQLTDIPVPELEKISSRVLKARQPLVIGGSTTTQGASAGATELAAAVLNVILDPDLALYDFDQRHRVEIAETRATVVDFWKNRALQTLDLLILNNVNPLYTLPAASGMGEAFQREDLFVVALSNFMDESAAASDLILPTELPLETWDVYESKMALKSALQPAMGKITSAPGIGDLFLQLLPADQRPAADYRSYLIKQMSSQDRISNEGQWNAMLQSGGQFVANRAASRPALISDGGPGDTLASLATSASQGGAGAPVAYLAPSLRYLDGRGANRPWLSEIPDTITMTAWQSLAWIHPKTMSAKGLRQGDQVLLASSGGSTQVIVYSYDGLHPDAMVIPLGQGHTAYGRYARNQGVNPVQLMSPRTDAMTGAPEYSGPITKMDAAGKRIALASVSGSRTQHHRKIALSIPLQQATIAPEEKDGLGMDEFPLTLPLPEGYDHRRDIYPPHEHEIYRWGMVIDLDRCIGCMACVGACYAENNVGIVGEKQVVNGREMAWLRIERYLDTEDPTRQIFLPMLCQHCDDAPCEAVCPVYAPHHSKEGLNNQIYNRCIGTRFCAQNCPYKVRRFNWFDWQWPEPLNLQLNPRVTVRSKGIMEKCSFCVQRIKAAHDAAKNEQRPIRDGEVIPACVQTCPTNAIYFGNLMDLESTVRKMIKSPRVYQVMGYLNTKPAVFYLKKVIQTI